MTIPFLSSSQIAWLSQLVAEYISSQRNRYFPEAKPLSRRQKTAVSGFFTPELLEEARVALLIGERVANPDFYPMLSRFGIHDLPDQSTSAAITFADTVVAHEVFTDELLFHELVHVEQYRQLGISKFAELYVRGFLGGGSYDGIPLERSAYMLCHQFETNTLKSFSVADAVAAWIAEHRL